MPVRPGARRSMPFLSRARAKAPRVRSPSRDALTSRRRRERLRPPCAARPNTPAKSPQNPDSADPPYSHSAAGLGGGSHLALELGEHPIRFSSLIIRSTRRRADSDEDLRSNSAASSRVCALSLARNPQATLLEIRPGFARSRAHRRVPDSLIGLALGPLLNKLGRARIILKRAHSPSSSRMLISARIGQVHLLDDRRSARAETSPVPGRVVEWRFMINVCTTSRISASVRACASGAPAQPRTTASAPARTRQSAAGRARSGDSPRINELKLMIFPCPSEKRLPSPVPRPSLKYLELQYIM